MTIEQKLTEISTTVEGLASLKGEVQELRDALAAKSAAPAVVEHKDEVKELRAKFFELARTGEGFNTDLVKDGVAVKSLNVTPSQAGTADSLVIAEVSKDIIKRAVEDYTLPSLFSFVTSGNPKFERRVMKGRSGAKWDGENHAGTNGAHTATPEFETVRMTSGKAVAKPLITQEALSDPYIDVEALLMDDVRSSIGSLVAEGLLAGEGSANQPKGFLKHFDKTEGVKDLATRPVDHFAVELLNVTTADDAALIDALHGLTFKVITRYRNGGKFVMSAKMYQRVAGIKDGQGRPMMQPSLDAAVAGRIFGYDIVCDANLGDDVPAMFGDFASAFTVVSIPTTLDFIRNPYKIDFCVEYTIAQRVGTIIGSNQAVVGLMHDATKSRSK